jgi:[acyl-carrier-protein] S-malonyltransferase
MASTICDEVPAAKELFDKASAILGYDLLAKCKEGPKDVLDSTVSYRTVGLPFFFSPLA